MTQKQKIYFSELTPEELRQLCGLLDATVGALEKQINDFLRAFVPANPETAKLAREWRKGLDEIFELHNEERKKIGAAARARPAPSKVCN